MRIIRFFLLIFIALLEPFWPMLLSAQDSPLSPQQVAMLAENLGLDLNSRHLARVINLQRQRQSGEGSIAYQDPQDEAPRAIVLQLRGSQGIPFPKPGEVVNRFAVSQAELAQSLKRFDQRIKEHIEAQSKPPPSLPRCDTGKTVREDFGIEFPGGPKQTMLDLVIVEKGKEPRDPDEIFGKGVMILPYTSDEADPISIGLSGLGITCLPARLRVTSRYRYRHEGIDALRNYSEEPDGKGRLHEYYQEPKEPRRRKEKR